MQEAKVLIIEDDAITKMDLIEHMKIAGCDVVHAVSNIENTRQVLNSREDPLDLVLTDYHLANDGMGSEAVRMVKSHSPTVRAILISSLNQAMLEQKTRTCNADAFVTKLVDFRNLNRTIQNQLELVSEGW